MKKKAFITTIMTSFILISSYGCLEPREKVVYRKKASNQQNQNNQNRSGGNNSNSSNSEPSNGSSNSNNSNGSGSNSSNNSNNSPSTPQGGFVFVGASNVGMCKEKGTFATGELLRKVMAEHPDAVVWGVGDNQYNDGSQEEYDKCYNASGWGDYLGQTLAAVGDHDKDLDVWINNFSDNNGSLLQDSTVTGETYFSYERGSWLIIGLDSQNKPSGQLAWLENLLQNSDAPCTLAMWHHPGKLTDAYELLYKYGADVILLGHAHYYQRFSLQDANGNQDDAYGIRQFIVATGGASLSNVSGGEASQSVFGITKFVLGDDSYSWEFMPIEGSFSDQGSAKCHGPPQ